MAVEETCNNQGASPRPQNVITHLWVMLLVTVVSFQCLGVSTFAQDSTAGVPVTVTGELTILYVDDFKNKRGELLYFLKDAKSKRTFKLRFATKPPAHLRSGAILTARGKAKGYLRPPPGTTRYDQTHETVAPEQFPPQHPDAQAIV
jgi:hypothetical protein